MAWVVPKVKLGSQALKQGGLGEKVEIATKFGIQRTDGSGICPVRLACDRDRDINGVGVSCYILPIKAARGGRTYFDHNKLNREMAQKKKCTPSQLALAPIQGMMYVLSLVQPGLKTLAVKLTAQDMAELVSMASFNPSFPPTKNIAILHMHAFCNSSSV
ncbi:hypothetical protein QVD17_11204 [Tagetes erecta]|uniref:Uncharacterized protein n=1 Tax=Tagetes erecta TaxID=13708 RepID=A0AAD8KT04_TARER|nr:hypothetical protein QVD17_11204 [Tagetes erecta]